MFSILSYEEETTRNQIVKSETERWKRYMVVTEIYRIAYLNLNDNTKLGTKHRLK